LRHLVLLALACAWITLQSLLAAPAEAAPGVCVGPVCGDEISRSAKHHFQLRLRLTDQQGHRERVVVDCRDARVSPEAGPVERGHARAVARRACRLAGEAVA
jgi:hypothetical protein